MLPFRLFIAKFRMFLLLLLFLNFCGNEVTAQEKNRTEILQLIEKAYNYMDHGDYERSLVTSRLALQHSIDTKEEGLIAHSYLIIAANFDELAEPEKALIYYKKGIVHAQKSNNSALINKFNNNLGNIYCFDKKQYTKGIYYYKKSLEHSKKVADSSQILLTRLNITWVYFDIGRFEEGLPYLNFINRHNDKWGGKNTSVAINMLNGMYYNHKNDSKQAHYYFQKAIKLGNTGNEKSDLGYSHQEYSKFLMKIGDYKNAYKNLYLFNEITAEENVAEKLKKANVAGINLEIDEYKREIDKIESEFTSKESKLIAEQSRNKKVIVVIFSLFIICGILFYFFFQNTTLKQKNKLKNIQSKIQQNIINASIDGQESERKKIAGFLHDNISASLSSAALHLNVFTLKHQFQSEEILKTKTILEEAHNQIRDLSHQLMPTLLIRFGLFFALDDLCEKNSNSMMQIQYQSTIPIKTRYNDEFEMKLYFIITELLNNIIKHSQASQAQVTLEKNNTNLLLKVSDNGKGFRTQKLEIAEGFGLNQIRARINNMKGTITVKSKKNFGTTIVIEVAVIEKEAEKIRFPVHLHDH